MWLLVGTRGVPGHCYLVTCTISPPGMDTMFSYHSGQLCYHLLQFHHNVQHSNILLSCKIPRWSSIYYLQSSLRCYLQYVQLMVIYCCNIPPWRGESEFVYGYPHPLPLMWGVCNVPSVGACVSPVHCLSPCVAFGRYPGCPRSLFSSYMYYISTWYGHYVLISLRSTLLSPTTISPQCPTL